MKQNKKFRPLNSGRFKLDPEHLTFADYLMTRAEKPYKRSSALAIAKVHQYQHYEPQHRPVYVGTLQSVRKHFEDFQNSLKAPPILPGDLPEPRLLAAPAVDLEDLLGGISEQIVSLNISINNTLSDLLTEAREIKELLIKLI